MHGGDGQDGANGDGQGVIGFEFHGSKEIVHWHDVNFIKH